MKLYSLRIGTAVEIHIKRGGATYRIYRSVEFSDDRRIGVLPIVKNENFEFYPTDEIDIYAQKDSKSYMWKNVTPSVFVTRFGVILHSFSSSEDALTVNRRKTFRVGIRKKITIKYEITDKSELEKKKGPASILGIEKAFSDMFRRANTHECPGYLVDLSEGGASISAPCQLKRGDFISFELSEGRNIITCRGVVVRYKPTPQNRTYVMNYGIAFTETSSNYVSYLYAVQRKNIVEKKEEKSAK